MRPLWMNRHLLRRLVALTFQRNSGHVAQVNPGPPINYDYVPVPFKPFKPVYDELQTKFNRYLGISIVLFVSTFALAAAEGVFMFDLILPPYSYRYRHKIDRKEKL